MMTCLDHNSSLTAFELVQVLIFSKATRMLNIIENFIRREGYHHHHTAPSSAPPVTKPPSTDTPTVGWTVRRP
jgi:hypothetical protein